MAPKEPTRAQLSSRLTYTSGAQPAFLRRLQNKITGTADSDEEDPDEGWEDDGSGRPPIPRRPAIPERPEGEGGSEDEDERDEAPQIVVLREGKHLSGWEVENERRKAKGLPPLPKPSENEPNTEDESKDKEEPPPKKERSSKGLNFSTSGTASQPKSKKRKVVPVGEGDGLEDAIEKKAGKKKKKAKVGLSFADDAA